VRKATWLGLLALALAAGPAPAEEIELLPDGKKHFGGSKFFAPITSLFLGPGYWWGKRRIAIETTPPDATVHLFYVRAGFQKRFEETFTPVTVHLPRRIDANPKDVVIVRAFLDGYRVREQTVKVSSRTDRVLIEMEPLPNVLQAVAHTYFGGRGSVSFLTKEALSLRVQEKQAGFSAALHETARGGGVDEELGGIRSPLLAGLEAHQLGEDLMVQFDYGPALAGAEPEIRSRSNEDAIRELYVYTLDVVGPDAGEAAVTRTKAALAKITPADVSGCAARFDQTLREGLDPAALSRALTPSGRFVDPYLRAAMRRLGQVSPGGHVELLDGTRYLTEVPLQLAAAQNDAAQARGYLALLRRLVALLEAADERTAVLRGLVAPELPAARFADSVAAATTAERTCAPPP
jgi:hypothetical protein